MKKVFYKSMKAGLKAQHGNLDFKVGQWYHQDGKIEACKNGFHASKNIIDAMGFVNCEILAEVEMKGKSDLSEDDKVCYSDMKITKAYVWTKEASVKLAIFAAELCLDNFEKEFPKDKRPREAIEAAKKVLENDTEENRSAAGSAAWSAARSAARSAAGSAEAAAWSAWSAAESAWSAWSAAGSAAWSARSAEKVLTKCHKFIIKEIIPTLEIYE